MRGDQSTRLFIYGSLRRGALHHELLCGASPLGLRRLPGWSMVVFQEGYPAIAPGPPDDVVHGELYAVPPTMLAALDEFEECPRLYQRRPIQLADGTPAEAYVIEKQQARGCPVVKGGDWLLRR